jgi:hypothetical protein
MKKLSDYNNKKLCECFNCFDMKNKNIDITQTNIELKDTDGNNTFSVVLERGKFLSYFGTRFAKINDNGIIHIFKDYMG